MGCPQTPLFLPVVQNLDQKFHEKGGEGLEGL